MTSPTASAFDLPGRLTAKSAPELIADDDRHFAAVAGALDDALTDLTGRLDAERRRPGGSGQGALDRDQEIHRLSARLRVLRRFALDLCLGRMVPADGSEPVYIGRLGLTDAAGRRLLVDWRSPAAEPFFAATLAHPMGLASRRRYRWTGGRITDYWDESFVAGDPAAPVALDDESTFIASLGASRSPRMRDVLATIAADQDAIIRAGSRGALVVDGGPGTGKTVVALHRAAYLLYADPHLDHRRGGVLFVGPHEPYLAYVADVLPSLGEDGVRTCTVRDLVPEGPTAAAEADPAVARLKADARMRGAIEPAVGLYEQPPTTSTVVETPWGDLEVDGGDWAAAYETVEPATAHNEARAQIWAGLADVLAERIEDVDVPVERLRRVLEGDRDLVRVLHRAWPVLDAGELVADLWSVPAYLRRCAPWLTAEEVAALRRDEGAAWTVADLPLLDAARARLGDGDAEARTRRNEAVRAAERERMADIAADLIAADDSELLVMSMLRGADLQAALADQDALSAPERDPLTGPFAHVIVDEAQELTDAQWQMLLARCPSRSFTIVGDRAQARGGFAESWEQRLARVGFGRVERATLTVNYRTPREVMAEAEPVIRAVLADANVPTSIRATGRAVRHGSAGDLAAVVDAWLAEHEEGTVCVVGAASFAARPRVSSLSPELVKGLEFDLVVLVDPQAFGDGVAGAVDRYVAMTRATSDLVILTT